MRIRHLHAYLYGCELDTCMLGACHYGCELDTCMLGAYLYGCELDTCMELGALDLYGLPLKLDTCMLELTSMDVN